MTFHDSIFLFFFRTTRTPLELLPARTITTLVHPRAFPAAQKRRLTPDLRLRGWSTTRWTLPIPTRIFRVSRCRCSRYSRRTPRSVCTRRSLGKSCESFSKVNISQIKIFPFFLETRFLGLAIVLIVVISRV